VRDAPWGTSPWPDSTGQPMRGLSRYSPGAEGCPDVNCSPKPWPSGLLLWPVASYLRAHGLTPRTQPGSRQSRVDQLQPLVGAAMRNPNARLIRSYIEQHGFRPSMPHSRGAIRLDGSELLTFVFTAQEGSKDHALIAWSKTATGEERVQGDIIHYLQDSGPSDSLEAASQYIKTTGLSVVNGQVVVVDDYWSCFWKSLVGCCGPGAIGCLWACPAWLECVYAFCGFCVYYAMWACY